MGGVDGAPREEAVVMELNKIYCMDAKEGLKLLPDDYIDLTVTSPPYDDLRTYKGYSFDFEPIAKELYRATKPGGVVVWVVGDATVNGSETGTSFRQALYFMGCGFNLHDTMIYQKPAKGAKGSNYCYWQEFEYMFVLSKGKPNAINLICDIINNYAGKNTGMASDRSVRGSMKNLGVITVSDKRRRGNVWRIDSGYMKTTSDNTAYQHPAIFPEKLANDHIISWSNPGDLVLDPFMGSGTTGKMAALNRRHYIGFDISEEYCEIARKRIAEHTAQQNIFNMGVTP